MGQLEELTLWPHVLMSSDGRQRIAAELGRLRVPERRDRPDGGSVELTFVRIRCRGERRGPPIVYLSGGPGSPAIRSLQAELDWYLNLCEHHDLIVFDQRGVGLSRPCLSAPLRWDLPLDVALTRDALLEAARQRSLATAAFWRERGVDLAGYTSVESADDIDAIRRALGAEQVILWGASYGSHLALTTIRRHGPHIARAVVALVEGPDHTYKLPSNIQRQLATIAARAAADPALDGRTPDMLALLGRVLARLEQEPATVERAGGPGEPPHTITVGAFDLQLHVSGDMGDLDAIRLLPARLLAMEGGDFGWLAGEALAFRRSWFSSAMSCHMDLASGATAGRLAQIAREIPETLLGDAINLPYPYFADAWGSPDLGDSFRAPIQSDVPVLFVSGALDGRTPPSNAEEVRAGFSRCGHIVVDGWAHGTEPELPEYLAIERAFLAGAEPADAWLCAPFAFAPAT